MKLSKKIMLAAVAVAGLVVASGASGALAAEGDWDSQTVIKLNASPYNVQYPPTGGCQMMINNMYVDPATGNLVNTNPVAGERVEAVYLNGSAEPLPGDAVSTVGEGTHTYTYLVRNLSTNETDTKAGEPFVATCPAPSATLGPITATANDDGTTRSISVGGSVTLDNIAVGDVVTVVTTASNGATTTTTIPRGENPGFTANFTANLTGTFPDGNVTVSSQTYVNGQAVGAPSGSSVTFVPPVDPEPDGPTVGADIHGVLTDENKSAVHTVVTIDRNGHEGDLEVELKQGETLVWSDTFHGDTETLRATPLVGVCGEGIEFTVVIVDFPDSEQTYTVDVPCPVTDGNNGGNGNGNGDGSGNGGTGNGSTNGGTGDGSTNGGTTTTTDTTTATDTTSDTKKDGGEFATGDTYLPQANNAMTSFGGLTAVGGAILVLALAAGVYSTIHLRRTRSN